MHSNSGNGIEVFIKCLVVNNACADNGVADGANIYASSSDNRIEGNNVTGAPRGIQTAGSGNFIARNTASGNTTNWEIAANNKCLVVLGANAGAISGNSGGVSPGSTDPNANFTY